ncbi:hypothetical protein [Methylobacterium planeticum]|uniref:Uncharacterized protein n=1 Tax=Methylobacterium planeticum TaxID=2615211 RepID=A0A6N6MIE8_9HYPH|nr:hypothetical protein [Methylobacterium planeticum]KAB1068550.1 hypothetical protein F6X51_26680 [Methylobacterium planeticum]
MRATSSWHPSIAIALQGRELVFDYARAIQLPAAIEALTHLKADKEALTHQGLDRAVPATGRQ